ncbi:hypothetical protein [Parabacteroides johnsonii]|uniref:hypothetical protein n=1 Tax=Parabacteroides johnsonii TaxID=387661 RepID=UPI00242C30F0|nr:hypothetical protein [Parabacteroides johnsonii]MBS6225176.1 hypothetical protein [Parabacteroides johnsonii]
MKIKTTYIHWILVAVLLISLPDMAFGSNQKKKKEKKPKKEFVWDWDGKKTGVEEVDEYLLGCDTLWTGIEDYRKDVACYKYYDHTFSVNDKNYTTVFMIDTVNKRLLSPGLINWQFAQSTGAVTLLALTATNLALQTTNATMALPKLGLNAFTYGKYIKAGPIIIGKAKKEFDAIRSNYTLTRRRFLTAREESVPMEEYSPELKEKLKELFSIKTDEEFEKYFKKHILVVENVEKAEVEVVTEEVIVEKTEDEKDQSADNIHLINIIDYSLADIPEGETEPTITNEDTENYLSYNLIIGIKGK